MLRLYLAYVIDARLLHDIGVIAGMQNSEANCLAW